MWSVTSTLPPDTPLEVEDAKSLLRDGVRSHRRCRSDRECQRAAELIAEHAGALVQGAHTVAAYAARRHEPGTDPLLAALTAQGAQVLLPVLGAGLRRDWARHVPGEELRVRAPGRPPEPDGPCLGESAVAEAELVLVPALSVDTDGYRLGQGGGWYDRALLHADDRARIYAVIYEDEVSTEPLPRAEHDIPVHGVITPAGVRTFRRRPA